MTYKTSKQSTRGYWAKLQQTASGLGYDWVLFFLVLFICIAGLSFFASSLSFQTSQIYLREFAKQAVLGVGLGFIAMYFLARTDYKLIVKNSHWIVLINILLLAFLGMFAIYVAIVGFGLSPQAINQIRLETVNRFSNFPIAPHAANNSIRWITSGFTFLPNFQPSELAKGSLLLYFAKFIPEKSQGVEDFFSLKRPFYALVAASVLILLQPDVGTTAMIFAIIITGLWTSNISKKLLSTIFIVTVTIGTFLIIATGYNIQRINAFLGQTDVENEQVEGVKRAVQNGGIWGVGYGQSEFKKSPSGLFEESTDAIIAVIAEEMGFVVTMLFLSLYLVFLFRGLEIAKKAPDAAGRVLATGISFWIVAQAFLNITGITGLAPLTGIPIPFVSKGGTAMLINLASVGILLNISRQGNLAKK